MTPACSGVAVIIPTPTPIMSRRIPPAAMFGYCLFFGKECSGIVRAFAIHLSPIRI